MVAMTRCLDCGSERIADQCPACGLTSAAAELVFRRHLFNRTAIFLRGTLAVILDRRAHKRQDVEVMKRVYSGFIPLPWILAATLFLNGKLDAPKNLAYFPTRVESRFYMNGIV